MDKIEMQKFIDSGTFLRLEGSVGRDVVDRLKALEFRFPLTKLRDYYGNPFPSHEDVWKGHVTCRDFTTDQYREKWNEDGSPREEVDVLSELSISAIALRIRMSWKNIYFGAVPYLDAMTCLTSVDDSYGLDSGRSVVGYFLANARTWKGDVAKQIKKELNRRLKTKKGGA